MRLLLALFLVALPLAAQAQITNSKSVEGAESRGTIDSELLYQVRFGGVADVQYLIGRGANPGQVNEIGWPLVSIAASRTDGLAVPILRELIKAGADIDQGGPSRMFPVIAAARRGDAPLMDFLLHEALADFDVQDANGVKVSEIARVNGHPEMADQIKKIEEERSHARRNMTSEERRADLQHQLLFTACANEYLIFYYRSKQDKFTQAQIDDSLDTKRSDLSVITNDMVQIFHYDTGSISRLGKASSIMIKNELVSLVSNRNRRSHGVGAKGDIEKRCTRIADTITKQMQDGADAKAAAKEKRHDKNKLGW